MEHHIERIFGSGQKKRGYETLRQIYVQLKPKATIEDVKKQINTLRSNYRKELKKIKDSKRTGSASESVYEPSAWTFYELQFLADVEIPDKGRSSIIKQNEVSKHKFIILIKSKALGFLTLN